MAKENHSYRSTLPVRGHSEVNLCSVISLGKDLSKIVMPVTFNEPLSFLQRVAEYMEYAKLLKLAAAEETPLKRLEYVSAFAVSALASNWERLGKPFNPLLGETYELEREDFRILCEQVSHHPPVSAFHADSDDFIFHGSIHPKLKFWGKNIEIHPKGIVTVELPKWKEAYTWQNVNCILHNVVVGQLWMEQLGALEIKQHGGANLKATLSFKSAGSSGKDLHRVEGFITDSEKKRLVFLYGKWTEKLRACEPNLYDETLERIKREAKSPIGSPGHKKVLAKLNSLTIGAFKPSHQDAIDESTDGEDCLPKICPTDSRLRPDIRKLENGDQDGAAAEKVRLEEKQRDSKKSKKHKKAPEPEPRWFQSGVNTYTGLDDWLYRGGYWDRKFSDIEDIF
ncbi:Similar to Osbpl2: Oxysterol-binding protein-related protein 2 (Mus musculus) [Cotesia congregata]|uniref:Oxysterol-binding protein n=1 Tax=Cotesia congregata TaxID=51543 RepID=A0A8J2HG15_COTCN|nr:Similar to Osbpl2: Oxysterol-binding protein-related protein 2 (Mus musculus) [Cotesia congregata]